MNHYIGIDIGGTSVNVGVVDDTGVTLAKQSRPSVLNDGLEAGLRRVYDAVEQTVSESGIGWDRIQAIGAAAPGTMDIHTGVIFQPFNLPGWEDLPLRDRLADWFGKPTVLHNDANAAAYGEYWVGTGRHARSLMFWTLGTGIGGGIVIDGHLLTGAHSHGGECGHMIIQMDGGQRSPHGIHGALELYASAKALVRRCREELDAGNKSLLAEWLKTGEELTPKLIAAAAEEGDQLADDLIMDTARYLAIGTINMMHTINPEMVVLGGAMTFGQNETELGRRFLAHLKGVVKAHAFPILAERTIIDYATLGSDAGFIGAAGCARAAVDSDVGVPVSIRS
ncbi:MAG: ROK family protein [Planctomycetaceae bacterium]|nr:ROK family protein [Planctomycetaceae bacterium]